MSIQKIALSYGSASRSFLYATDFARGLMTVCERVFREFKFRLPSTRVKRLIVTAEVNRARTWSIQPSPSPAAAALTGIGWAMNSTAAINASMRLCGSRFGTRAAAMGGRFRHPPRCR